jgi:ribosomal protein L16 Arg81 hydroxylase
MALLDLGLSRQEFFDSYFEQRCLFKKAAVSSSIVDFPEVDRIVYGWDPADPTLRLYLKGAVPQSEYLESWDDVDGRRARIVPAKIRALLSSGATLVLDRIERKIPAIGQICCEVGELVSQQVCANAYIAFGGEGTFGKHWDTHDVLAIQLIGTKRWRVFAPTHQLPLRCQTSKYHKAECPDAPVFEVDLSRGDALYLPRGWWHEVLPLPNEESLHISIGIHTLRAIDYLLWFSKRVLPEYLPSRVTVGPNAANQSALKPLLKILERELLRNQHIDTFLQEHRAPPPCLSGSFLPRRPLSTADFPARSIQET